MKRAIQHHIGSWAQNSFQIEEEKNGKYNIAHCFNKIVPRKCAYIFGNFDIEDICLNSTLSRKIRLMIMMKYKNFETKIWEIVQKTKNEIIPQYESHWDTLNQMRLENFSQYESQCDTKWDSQNHMKRTID